jgi:hypothetical protein
MTVALLSRWRSGNDLIDNIPAQPVRVISETVFALYTVKPCELLDDPAGTDIVSIDGYTIRVGESPEEVTEKLGLGGK